jgi:hypothetical protein
MGLNRLFLIFFQTVNLITKTVNHSFYLSSRTKRGICDKAIDKGLGGSDTADDEIAEGENTPFIDLVVVGCIDRVFFNQLVEKAEEMLNKKIMTAVYSSDEFRSALLKEIPSVRVFKQEKEMGVV